MQGHGANRRAKRKATLRRTPAQRRAHGIARTAVAATAERLATQRLIEPVGTGSCYALAQPARERLSRTIQVGDQVGATATLVHCTSRLPIAELVHCTSWGTDRAVGNAWDDVGALQLPEQLDRNNGCPRPRRRQALQETLSESPRQHRRHGKPEKSHAPNQRHVVTDAGAALNVRCSNRG